MTRTNWRRAPALSLRGGETYAVNATVTAIDRCRTCSQRLQRPSTGRPPRYCSDACRRAAEFAVRPVARRLETLETAKSEARTDGALGVVSEERTQVVLHAYRAEIQRLESRLRELLEEER
jgi:hypothetical protein